MNEVKNSDSLSISTALRPFSVNGFERKVMSFQTYIDEITLKDSEDPPDERRQQILGLLFFYFFFSFLNLIQFF